MTERHNHKSNDAAQSVRAFAVLPAAGRSRRMGRPKLLLPWGDGLLVDGVVGAWQSAGVEKIVAVVHPLDTALSDRLQHLGVQVVAPASPPPDMKDSVRIALAHIRQTYQPTANDVWLLAPADMPDLSAEVARQIIHAAPQHEGAIIVPTHQGKSGHPALFPWPLAAEVERLSEDEGVNALLQRHAVVKMECGPAALARDIDTPEDYEP